VQVDVVIDADAVGEDGEAEITQWLVADGVSVTTDELIAEIETAKALVEIRATATGRLHHARPAGAVLAAGDLIGKIVSD
jgi:pyruvate/2-oxoglutarate dehydrogenase complex dihydrolipoamide acyltransferase (E2) component